MDNPKDKETKEVSRDQEDLESFCRFLSLKNEKLSSALYLITDFLSDNEPLKFRLRQRALDLVTDISHLRRDRRAMYRSGIWEKILYQADEIVSLLEVAMVGSSVSRMNLTILKDEYFSFRDLVEKKFLSSSIHSLISTPDSLMVPTMVSSSAPMNNHFPPRSSSYVGGQKFPSSNHAFSIGQVGRIKDTNKDNIKKNDRQKRIIDFIKDKGWLGIAEISKVVSDCSSKTIQRELADLVSQGVLKKQGDRRWSRYLHVS